MFGYSGLSGLMTLRDYRSKRVSSFDRTGANKDRIVIESGERRVIADIKGPGCIKHIWTTVGMRDKLALRAMVIRMYWDNAGFPSVEVPIGDFFGLGHGKTKNFVSAPLQMSPQDGRGFNSYWPMSFNERAIIEVENQGPKEYSQYFYIDYEEYDNPANNIVYFHSQWRREADTKGWAFEEKLYPPNYWGNQSPQHSDKEPDPRIFHKSDQGNYVICETEGNGIYCGAHLDIDCFQRNPNDWFGEGDDMICIDGEDYPYSIHGTGTEDWYNCAFCPRQEYNAPYHGIILYSGNSEWTPEDRANVWPWRGKQSVYRYHIEDPIRFRTSIRVSIEHGHANKLSHDYSSTAYYYLDKPTRIPVRLLQVTERYPRSDFPVYQPATR